MPTTICTFLVPIRLGRSDESIDSTELTFGKRLWSRKTSTYFTGGRSLKVGDSNQYSYLMGCVHLNFATENIIEIISLFYKLQKSE